MKFAITERNLAHNGKLQRHTCVPAWVRAGAAASNMTAWRVKLHTTPLPDKLDTPPEELWTMTTLLHSSFTLSELAKGGEQLLSLAFLGRSCAGIFDGTYLVPVFTTQAGGKSSSSC